MGSQAAWSDSSYSSRGRRKPGFWTALRDMYPAADDVGSTDL
jgi:hypothetical protein